MDQIPLVIFSWIIMMSPQGGGGSGFGGLIMLIVIIVLMYFGFKKLKGWGGWSGGAMRGGSSEVSSGVSSGTVRLDDQKIKNRWGQIIEGGSGKSDVILKLTQEFLKEGQAPGVTWDFIDVKTGWFSSRRQYLGVSNEMLKDWRMYIAARDYGSYLDVQWYLTVEPGFLKRTLSKAVSKAASGQSDDQVLSYVLNIFEQQELNAYTSTVHHCLKKAVEKVATDAGQDPSKYNWNSKGFLDIWG